MKINAPAPTARMLALALSTIVGAGACVRRAVAPVSPPPPPGTAWLADDQIAAARIVVEPVGERPVGNEVSASGRLTFHDLHVAHVFSPLTGRVVRIDAAAGQRVKKGDALLVIDSPDLGNAYSDLAKAEGDLVAAGREQQWQTELVADKAGAVRNLEAANDALTRARAEHARARDKARLLRAGPEAGASEDYTLRAPIAGEVIARNVNPGSEVQGQYGGGTAVELLHALRSLLVAAPDGTQVPLGELADIVEEDGPVVIYREDNQRYTPVKFSVRGRDLTSAIGEAQASVARAVQLPYDTRLDWAGEINQLHEAASRLAVIVPLTLLLIAFIVYTSVGALDMLIVLLGVPVAASGGVLALYLTGTELSISAAMGFISILGIAVQDALIVVTYAHRLWAEGHGLQQGARLAAERRLRPVLMTTSVAMLGLLPAALSRGLGSETQKPLAIVVICGALALTMLPRLIQAPLLVLAGRLRAARAVRGEIPPLRSIRAKRPTDGLAAVAPVAPQPRSSSLP